MAPAGSSDSASFSNAFRAAGNAYGGADMPGPNDVLLGRGSGISNHIGNIKFRRLVEKHKPRYTAASRVDKVSLAGAIRECFS